MGPTSRDPAAASEAAITDPHAPELWPTRRERVGRELRRRRGLRSTSVQVLYLLIAAALGLAAPEIPIGFTVPAERATQALLAVGIGIVTFIGIVYSLLFLVMQFGTTTFTPRLNLFRDAPIVWHAFGFFAGIFVFAFTTAFSIGQDDQEVTGLIPVLLTVMLLSALVMFRRLQTTAFNSIQLASTLTQVADRGREVIDHLYPPAGSAPSPAEDMSPLQAPRHDVTWPHRAAVLQLIDLPPLLLRAQREGVTIEFYARPGQTLAEEGVVAIVRGRCDADLDRAILAALRVAHERTFEQDPLFALRVLADIALRGMSSAINDPTTAVEALDAIDSLLRPLARRELDVGRIRDAQGTQRIVVPMPTWEDFIAVALDELLPLTQRSVHVAGRMRRLLEQLIELSLPEREAPLRNRLTALGA